MQRLRDPAAENAGRPSPMGESMRGLSRLNSTFLEKRDLKNKLSSIFSRCERSSSIIKFARSKKL